MSIFVGKSNKACRLQQHAVLAAGQRGVEILLKTTRDAQQPLNSWESLIKAVLSMLLLL